jgi:hypothetical protein
VSKVIRKYDGRAKDVETIIRLKGWMSDCIVEEIGKEGMTVSDCKFEWSYDPESEMFDYCVYAIA